MMNTNLYNKYNIFKKITLDKNIDRSRFYEDPQNKENKYLLAACYHLDKDTEQKIKELKSYSYENFEYGILDIKFLTANNKYNYDNQTKILTVNSDSSFSIINFENLKTEKNFKISEIKNNTCNTLDIMNNNNQD